MNDDHRARLRTDLDRELLAMDGGGSIGGIILKIASQHGKGQDIETRRVLVEYWGSLVRSGVGVALGDDANGIGSAWLTTWGRGVLQSSEPSPHDEAGFLAAVQRRVPSPNPVVMAYMAEAASAWRAMLYRSSAVMLGCACEKLIVTVAEAMVETSFPAPGLQKLLRAMPPPSISKVFELVHRSLGDVQPPLPQPIREGLTRNFAAVFEQARCLRNGAGHPTGEDVSPAEAHAGLLLFPRFYEYVSKLETSIRARV